MNRKGFIYKYTYPNGKVYIGQTRVSVEERHKQHMWASKHDDDRRCLCEVAIAKYGEPIVETIETIEVDDTNPTLLCKMLDEAEVKWIQKYDSTNTANGYNVMGGGQHKTSEKFILEEKWYQLFQEEKWGEFIEKLYIVLDSIGEKICNSKEKLTREEKSVWYGYNFRIIVPELEMSFGKTNFNAIYKSVLNDNIKMIAKPIKTQEYPGYEHLEKKMLLKSQNDEICFKHIDDNPNKPWIMPFPLIDIADCYINNTLESKESFDNIIEQSMVYVIEDIRQNVWIKVMKHKEKYIKEYYRNENTL